MNQDQDQEKHGYKWVKRITVESPSKAGGLTHTYTGKVYDAWKST